MARIIRKTFICFPRNVVALLNDIRGPFLGNWFLDTRLGKNNYSKTLNILFLVYLGEVTVSNFLKIRLFICVICKLHLRDFT